MAHSRTPGARLRVSNVKHGSVFTPPPPPGARRRYCSRVRWQALPPCEIPDCRGDSYGFQGLFPTVARRLLWRGRKKKTKTISYPLDTL